MRAYLDLGFKRFLDIVASSILLIPFLLLALLISIILFRDFGKDIFFTQKRVGRNGRNFYLVKFRTMRKDRSLGEFLDSDELMEWEKKQKMKKDPRVTKLGHFIRKFSLDEIPQLWNVLRGEMSLVGPRPVLQEELRKRYGNYSKYYISVRPGLTGSWQTSGRNDLSYRKRVQLDLEYVKNQSFFGDLKILIKTPFVVFSGKGAY